ncbi:unnamed protein product [Lampetra fluviatilis]
MIIPVLVLETCGASQVFEDHVSGEVPAEHGNAANGRVRSTDRFSPLSCNGEARTEYVTPPALPAAGNDRVSSCPGMCLSICCCCCCC